MFNYKLFKLLQNRFTVMIFSSRNLPENLSVEIPSKYRDMFEKKKIIFCETLNGCENFIVDVNLPHPVSTE